MEPRRRPGLAEIAGEQHQARHLLWPRGRHQGGDGRAVGLADQDDLLPRRGVEHGQQGARLGLDVRHAFQGLGVGEAGAVDHDHLAVLRQGRHDGRPVFGPRTARR